MSSVTRKSGGRRKARREAIVTDMLRVVEELMEDGASFADITVEQLITEAGISRSTFYVYFEDKGVLLLALAEDVVGRLIDAARVWWELPPDGTRADVESALRGIADVYAQHASIWSALVDTSAYDPNVRASFRGVVALAIEGVSRHIREGQKAGTVRAGLDPKRTAAWLTWMTERGHYEMVSEASKPELAKLVKAQADVVWFTLYDGVRATGD